MIHEEIRITVPWGHIAGTTFGEKTNRAVLVLHGSTHNSAVFEELISLLPSNFYYIVVDLPGHGYSSPSYQFLPISFVDNFVCLLHIMKHFERNQYIIIGHSMGASIASQFTQIYPEKVEKLFLIDFFYCVPNQPKEYFNMVRRSCDSSVTLANTPKVYTYEEILNIIQKKYYVGARVKRSIAEQAAKRMTKQVGKNQYVLTNDPRLSSAIFPCFPTEYIIKLLVERPIMQPCVVIKTKDMMEDDDLFNDMMKIHPHIKVIEVDGGHYIAQENPKLVAHHIEKFLLGDHKL